MFCDIWTKIQVLLQKFNFPQIIPGLVHFNMLFVQINTFILSSD